MRALHSPYAISKLQLLSYEIGAGYNQGPMFKTVKRHGLHEAGCRMRIPQKRLDDKLRIFRHCHAINKTIQKWAHE